jgi:hypothetical protein
VVVRGRSPRILPALSVAALLIAASPAQTALAGSAARPGAGAGHHRRPARSTPELLQSAVAQGELSSDQADVYLAQAIAQPSQVPTAYVSPTPWDGTLALLHLERVAEHPTTQRRAASQIARLIGASGPATDTQTTDAAAAAAASAASPARAASKKHADTCSSSRSVLPKTLTTRHFSIGYDPKAIRALSVHDYARALETSWRTEVTRFGWAAPPSVRKAHHRYHVRLAHLGGGLYGYTSQNGTFAGLVRNNPRTAWNDHDAFASCIVLNQDYRRFPSTPINSLRATAAHEFNHSIQFGMGALTDPSSQIRPDAVFVEGGATWMEDEVFTGSNDNRNYLWPSFDRSMGAYGTFPYPYWVVFRALTEPYGTGVPGGGENVMQRFWELTSKRVAGNIEAMRQALATEGVSLNDAFHHAAIALKFTRGCTGGYVEPTCLREGPADVARAGPTQVDDVIASVGDHVSDSIPDDYAMNWIRLPNGAQAGSPYDVALQNRSSGGALRASVVCDDDSSLSVTALGVAHGSQTVDATNVDPSGCESVVLVITNQANTKENPSSSTQRTYRADVS